MDTQCLLLVIRKTNLPVEKVKTHLINQSPLSLTQGDRAFHQVLMR